QLLSRTGLDAATARLGRVAAIAVVPGGDSASTGAGHARGNHSADRPRPCLRPRALHRRMDGGDRCSRLVPEGDHVAEAASLQVLGREFWFQDHGRKLGDLPIGQLRPACAQTFSNLIPIPWTEAPLKPRKNSVRVPQKTRLVQAKSVAGK